MQPKALLAIRSDIAASVESDYLAWLTREHTHERVGIKGFLSARVYRQQHAGFARFLILYELSDADVVDDPAYLSRLNNPTPWTTRIMPNLANFVRGGGPVSLALGKGYGTALLVAEIDNDAAVSHLQKALTDLPGIIAIRILKTDLEKTSVASNERNLRSGDRSFKTLMLIDCLQNHPWRQTTGEAHREIPLLLKQGQPEIRASMYALIFHLCSDRAFGSD